MLLILTLIFLVVVCGMAIFRPPIALAMVVFRFPIEQVVQAEIPFFLTNQMLMNFLVAGVALLSAVVALARTPQPFTGWMNPTFLATFALYAFSAISVIWTPATAIAAESLRLGWPYLVVLVIAGPALIRNVDDLRTYGWALVAVGGSITALMLMNPNLQMWASRALFMLDATRKSNPLEIGTLGAATALAAALMVPRAPSTFSILLRGAAFFMGLGLAFLSGSRGQVMFAVVIAVAFIPVARKLANVRSFLINAASAAAVLGGILLVVKFFVTDTNEERWSSESLIFGGEERFLNVVDLMNAYFHHPTMWIPGLGYYAFIELPTGSGAPYTHVLTADMLGELGVIGLTLFLVAVITGGRAAYALWRTRAPDAELRCPTALLLAFLVYEFLLAHKQGQLWGSYSLFLMLCIPARLRARDRLMPAPQSQDAWTDDEPRSDDGSRHDEDYPEASTGRGGVPAAV